MGKARQIILLALLVFSGCQEPNPESTSTTPAAPIESALPELVQTPLFSADEAYNRIADQVAFGPRVPNTAAHSKCAAWLASYLEECGLEVSIQKATVTAFDGTELQIQNIMARYAPEKKERLLLCAHWDTRPFADRDTERRAQPIAGANDGGSGVAVLLELARSIAADSLKPSMGFDIVLFDAEDYGQPEASMVGEGSNTWCLGSQHWAANVPWADYKPAYGILLDMVGGRGAVFPKEGASLYYAPQIVHKVWRTAAALGHDKLFVSFSGGAITDDHVYVNKLAGIPTIDVIHYEVHRSDFGTFHHTHRDDMAIIDKATLQAVGDVVMQCVYAGGNTRKPSEG